MKPRVLIAVVVLVAAPVVALGWLAWRLTEDEREMVRHRLDEAVRSRLAAVDGQVVRVVERWDREF
ncbi:MAG: hypothetical protein FJ087_08985, partial [Deltaproteobacteria bacterium]|nr:hypothetical protein [Deltaproteobacteria bacterium]